MQVRNVMDRLRKTCEGSCGGIETEYDYHPLGERSWVRDAAGNETHITYDTRGRRIALDDPDLGVQQFTFNGFGDQISQTDAKNQTITLAYDQLGRVITRTEPEGDTTWDYDIPDTGCNGGKPVGRLSKVTQPDGTSMRFCYDAYARLTRTARKLDTLNYFVNRTYDQFGRLNDLVYPASKSGNPAGWLNRFRVRHLYNEQGYLTGIQDYELGQPGPVLWAADEMDALGHVTQETLSNGLTFKGTYDQATGLVSRLWDTGTSVQDMSFTWDDVGNLTSRSDALRSLSETFDYDGLYRLEKINGVVEAEYDDIGNLTRKGAYTNYTYTSGPVHGVNTVDIGGATRIYTYDANGNLKDVFNGGARKNITWTSFDKPIRISHYSSNVSNFFYDHDRLRWKQISTTGGNSEIRYYVDGLYEKVVATGVTEHAHHIKVGDRTVAIFKRYASNPDFPETRWLHHDHLGSIVATTDELGNREESFSYDVWGKRRDPETWAEYAPTLFGDSNYTPRGFTEHEHLPHVGVIHMNGRVYDPEIGRFASADPYVQFPDSTQGLNRYSYVLNNPLSFTDPSGYGLVANLAAFVNAVVTVTGPAAGSEGGAAACASSGWFAVACIAGATVTVSYMPDKDSDPGVRHPDVQSQGAVVDPVNPALDSSSSDLGERFLTPMPDRIAERIEYASAADTGDSPLIEDEVLTANAADLAGDLFYAVTIGGIVESTKQIAAGQVLRGTIGLVLEFSPGKAVKAAIRVGKVLKNYRKASAVTNNAKAIKNARQRGVNRAKSAERDLVKSGHPGTADNGGWSFAERKRIAETGQFPSDTRWHHVNDVKRNPGLGDVADNVIPSRGGHAGHVSKYHPNGTQAGSSGPMLNRAQLKRNHMNGN